MEPMDFGGGDMADMIFKSVESTEKNSFQIDSLMLKVLSALNGADPLGIIAEKLNIEMNTLQSTISQLSDLQLVKPVSGQATYLGSDFFKLLENRFTYAVGPMAEFIIDDVIDAMGLEKSRIPAFRALELVENLAIECGHEEMREWFKQEMMEKTKDENITSKE